MANMQTHLEYNVAVDKQKFNVLGIFHNLSYAHSPTRQGTLDAINLHAVHSDEIFAERASLNFLPGHLVLKAKALEEGMPPDPLVPLFTQVKISELGANEAGLLREFAKPRFRKFLYAAAENAVGTLNSQLTEPEKENAKRYFCREMARTIVHRSLLMSEKILQSQAKTTLVVVGAVHAVFIKKFLENPRLRERYRKLWEKQQPRT